MLAVIGGEDDESAAADDGFGNLLTVIIAIGWEISLGIPAAQCLGIFEIFDDRQDFVDIGMGVADEQIAFSIGVVHFVDFPLLKGLL